METALFWGNLCILLLSLLALAVRAFRVRTQGVLGEIVGKSVVTEEL